MQVMVLAAGKSTRLGGLGAARPKPLLPVCGHPPLAYVLELCRVAGFTDVVVNVHHHAEQIRAALGDGSRFGVRVDFSEEAPEILGTGGGLFQARAYFRSEPVLVINGKVIADVDLTAVAAAHVAGGESDATMVVRRTPDAERFAAVEVDARGDVVALRGTRTSRPVELPTSRVMFTGIHVLSSRLLDRIPGAGFSDIIDVAYLPALREGRRIRALTLDGYFEEHSTPEDYLRGNLTLLESPSLLRHPPGPLTGIDATARIHPTAVIVPPVRIDAGAIVEADAHVGPRVAVGSNARVGRGAQVTDAVIWNGANVEGSLRHQVASD